VVGKGWTVTLNCNSTSSLSWEKDGNILPDHINWMPHKIRIVKVGTEDAGRYSCIKKSENEDEKKEEKEDEGIDNVIHYTIIVTRKVCYRNNLNCSMTNRIILLKLNL